MTESAGGWELLDWDSGVFGFPVARAQATAERNTLASTLDDARRAGIRLIYLQTESNQVASAAEALGGTMISERVTFARPVPAPGTDPIASLGNQAVEVEQWRGTAPTSELLQLARAAGHNSRFRLDPRIPAEVFERIYDAWITNSLNGQLADEVMVTRDGSTLSGLVTVGAKNGRADIGLLAVHAEARGRGLGKRLVAAALDWAVRQQFHEAQVVTQRANVEACRLYESCGYAIERGEYVFHFWP